MQEWKGDKRPGPQHFWSKAPGSGSIRQRKNKPKAEVSGRSQVASLVDMRPGRGNWTAAGRNWANHEPPVMLRGAHRRFGVGTLDLPGHPQLDEGLYEMR